jgi:hypothetical protein
VNVNNEESYHDTLELNIRNIANTTDGNLLVEIPAVVTTNNESNSRDQLFDMNGSADVLLNKNDDVVTRNLLHFNNF